MPCANTSGMPAAAREVDVDVDRVVVARGAAYSASVVRLIGGRCSGGSVSPTDLLSAFGRGWVIIPCGPLPWRQT
jgi:hypothetical protein